MEDKELEKTTEPAEARQRVAEEVAADAAAVAPPPDRRADWSPGQWAGDLLTKIGVYLGQDAMPRMAAALSYRTMFSLIPLLLCAFLVLKIFQDKGAAKPEETLVGRFLQNMMSQFGLNTVTITD